MLKRSIITIALIALFIVSLQANETKTIKVGLYNNPPLSSFVGDKPEGVFVDILNDVAQANNWQLEYKPVTLAAGLYDLRYGRIDLLPTLAYTKDRARLIKFNEENVFTNWGVVYTNKKNNIENISELEGLRFGVENGDIHAKAIQKLLKDFNVNTEIVWCKSAVDVFERLRNDEIDAGAVNKIFGYLHNKDQQLRTTAILFNPVNVRIGGSPLSSNLLATIDDRIVQLKSEMPGVYEHMIDQWLVEERRLPAWSVYLLYSLLFCSVLSVLGVLIQRRKANHRERRLTEETNRRKDTEKTVKFLKNEKEKILNSLDEEVLFIDHHYRIRWVNEAFKRVSPNSMDKVIGEKCHKLFFNLDEPCRFCSYEKTLLTNMPDVSEHYNKRFHKYYITKTNPVFDEAHNPLGFVRVLSDITEKKLNEIELIKAKEKAEQSDYLKSAFLANMSHEIRTPMNAILGFSELLEDDDITKDDRTYYLDIIQSNGQQLLKLISDILIFSQIEAGHINFKMAELDVNSFLKSVFEQFRNESQKSNPKLAVKLELDIVSDLRMTTDEMRLRQIIFNLLTNALKFTEEGTVTLGVKQQKEFMVFYVKDTGIGIDQKKHKEIFERFSQIENLGVKKATGSGLGLTISIDLIRRLGGEIKLDSELGKGSTFYLYHPLVSKVESSAEPTFSEIWQQ